MLNTDDVDNVLIVAAAEAATVAAAAADGPAAVEAHQANDVASAAPVAAAPDATGGEHLAAVASLPEVPMPLQGQATLPAPAAPMQVLQPCLPCSEMDVQFPRMSVLISSSDACECVSWRNFPAGCFHRCCSEWPYVSWSCRLVRVRRVSSGSNCPEAIAASPPRQDAGANLSPVLACAAGGLAACW